MQPAHIHGRISLGRTCMKDGKIKNNWLLTELQRYRLNLMPLLIFECLYYFVGSLIILPVTKFLFNALLSVLNLNFVDQSNFFQVLKNPIVVAASIVILLFFAYYILVEYVAIITCYNESRNGRRVYIWPLIQFATKRSLQIALPRNWLMILYVIIVIPFTNFGLASNFVQDLSVPDFIMDYINANPYYLAGFWVLVVFLILKVIQFFFVFHFFTLDKPDYPEASAASKKMIRHRYWRTIGIYIVVALVLALIFVVLGLLLVLMVTLIEKTTMVQNLITGSNLKFRSLLLMGTLAAFLSLDGTIMSVLNMPLILAGLSACFYHNCQLDQIAISDSPLVLPPEKPFWIRRRQVLGLVIVLAALISFKTLSLSAIYNADSSAILSQGTLVAGHRGDSTDTPENTAAALKKAIEIGADYVEIDVCETKDGVLVVSHDNNLKRLTGQDVDIWNSNYADLKDLDIGSHFSAAFADQRIMTLDEAMDICDGKIKMNIELKPEKAHDHGFVEKAVAIFQKHDFYDKGFFASLDYPTLQKVEKLDPKIRTCLNTFIALGNLQLLPVDIYSVEATFVTSSLVSNVHN